VVWTEIEEQFAVFLHAKLGPYNAFIAGRTTAFNVESGHENQGGCIAFIAVMFAVISNLL